jgi:hypothetical protein
MKSEDIKIMREKMEAYFSTVTPEQLESDLKKADFDFYNSLPDSPIVYDPNVKIYEYKDGNRFWWKIVIGGSLKRTFDILNESLGDSTCDVYRFPVTIYRDNVKIFFDDFDMEDDCAPKVDEIMTRYVQYIVSVGIGFSYYTKDKK